MSFPRSGGGSGSGGGGGAGGGVGDKRSGSGGGQNVSSGKSSNSTTLSCIGGRCQLFAQRVPPASKQKTGVSSGGDSVETRRLLTKNPDVGMGCSLSAEAPPS